MARNRRVRRRRPGAGRAAVGHAELAAARLALGLVATDRPGFCRWAASTDLFRFAVHLAAAGRIVAYRPPAVARLCLCLVADLVELCPFVPRPTAARRVAGRTVAARIAVGLVGADRVRSEAIADFAAVALLVARRALVV